MIIVFVVKILLLNVPLVFKFYFDIKLYAYRKCHQIRQPYI